MRLKLLLICLLLATLLSGCQEQPSITEFKFLVSLNSNLSADVTATMSGTNISVTVPAGTDVTALIASFTFTGSSVTVNDIAQTSGVTANDFSNPVQYEVTSQSSDPVAYIVTVTVATDTSDSTAPIVGSILINSNATTTTSTSVTLSLTATDDVGVTAYYVSESSTAPLATDSGWTTVIASASFSADVSFTLSSGSGIKLVRVWFKDAAGNVSSDDYDLITLLITATNISSISTKYIHTCAVTTDNKVKCWGKNTDGQLGNDSTTDSSFPVLVTGITTASQVATGYYHSCAILSDNSVKCWGMNDYGQLGNGSTTDSLTPVTVSGVSATQIDAGMHHTCAVLTDDTIKCWGRNTYGQLGNNSTTHSSTPVTVSGITTANQVTAGDYHSCAALTDNSTVQCWGYHSSDGQLGDNTFFSSFSSTPRTASVISAASQVSTQYRHSCARLTNNEIYCWGNNYNSQLGDGNTADSTTPVQVVGISTASQVAASNSHTCALLTDNTLKCWGVNTYGRLGDGTTTSSTSPVSVNGISTATQISAGSAHTCARLSDNTAKCWGFNSSGQLGEGGTSSYSITPVFVVD